jgi:hypothetical protein
MAHVQCCTCPRGLFMLTLAQQVVRDLCTALYSPTAPMQNHPHKMMPHAHTSMR